MNTWTFIITSLIIVLIPGTGVVYTISTGIANGKKAGVLAAAGCTAGVVPHLCASIALSSLLMKMSAQVFCGMKAAGTIYLLYLGVKMLLSGESLTVNNAQIKKGTAAIILRGIFINLLNPKLTLFFFSFLPQYVSTENQNYTAEALKYGFAFMLLTLIVFVGYGILSGLVSTFIKNCPKKLLRIQQLFGLTFIAFAVHLGVSSL